MAGDAGYTAESKGKDWVEKTLGLAAEIVRHPPKKPRYVWTAEGEEPSWEDLRTRGLLPKRGLQGALPRRWVVERSFGRRGHNRRMSKGLREGSRDRGGVLM